ncbi:hypothetical protein C4B68_26240 [Streptomyces dengpaensis]|uniref:Uncharacterized protein n=1 Tax=Streptomyces dengpaensis TaxID=2049881 RepID=A0ABN5I6F6_9ACTN|nr:hypothetical protein C4B68_26240 [Streptomyces dengpaensis]
MDRSSRRVAARPVATRSARVAGLAASRRTATAGRTTTAAYASIAVLTEPVRASASAAAAGATVWPLSVNTAKLRARSRPRMSPTTTRPAAAQSTARIALPTVGQNGSSTSARPTAGPMTVRIDTSATRSA